MCQEQVRCGRREPVMEDPAFLNPLLPTNALFWLLMYPTLSEIWRQRATQDSEKKNPFCSWAWVVSWEYIQRDNNWISSEFWRGQRLRAKELTKWCLNYLLGPSRQRILFNYQKKGEKNLSKHSEPQNAILIIKFIFKYLISSSFS